MYLAASSNSGNAVLGGFELLGIICFVIFIIWCFKR